MIVPKWAAKQISQAKDGRFRLLDLRPKRESHKPLTEIPADVFDLPWLEELQLEGNFISEVPDDILKLKKLKELKLNGSNLQTLPSSFGKLKSLTNLHLSDNRFETIPLVIFDLVNLRILDLSYNRIAELSEGINKLIRLQWLDLSSNRLSKLPNDLSALSNLRTLNLNENNIKELNTSISGLVGLVYLDLEFNQIEVLPVEIVGLERLQELALSSNPLIVPPPEIARKGLYEIGKYYQQLELGRDLLYEAKLLILGEAGAGKTTLANKIIDSTYNLKEEVTTRGVDIFNWTFPYKEKNFRLNIWDFGGQEIYHTTHQFFLTRRSLYTLVADSRKEDTDFYYWLNLIELLSDNSPLLIIKNEKQDRRREINERVLRGEFTNLKEVLPANFSDNRGLEKIKEEIKHYVISLPHVGTMLPKSWSDVRGLLEGDVHNYISLENYFALCRQNGFHDERDCLQLSGYLHDIGVFLHFQDDDLLRRTVFLKPEWATRAVYKVLDNPIVVTNLGQFTRSDLINIWGSEEYSNMHGELLQLMMRFRLCYKIPDSSDTYIAPQLLTENQPIYEWETDNNLLLRYAYEFMPKGILTQLIVLLHRFILEQKYVWKSGVVLEKEKSKAQVVEYYSKREIQVRVSGPHKKELMTIIMYQMDNIHASFRRPKYDKLIPCNCVECKSKADPYFFRFEVLHKFIEDKQNRIQCQQSYKMVNVRSLIDDVISKEYRESYEGEGTVTQNFYFGDGTKIDNLVTGGSIQNSFNKARNADISTELKQSLEQLAEAVARMSKELAPDQAKEVADDLERLVEEATATIPSKKWYSVSIDGLIKAAENLDKLGKPVIRLAHRVMLLLAPRSRL